MKGYVLSVGGSILRKILVTGGAGFIGSNFIRLILQKKPSVLVLNLDALTYAGNRQTMADFIDHPRHQFIHGDICDEDLLFRICKEGVDTIVNFAAESHDRSIESRCIFAHEHPGVQALIDAAIRCNISS